MTQNFPLGFRSLWVARSKSPLGSFTVWRTLFLSWLVEKVPPVKKGGLETIRSYFWVVAAAKS